MYGGKRDKEWITYSTEEVSNYVNWVSYGLLALGYKKGDKVATISGNKPEWNFVDMGLAQTGLYMYPSILQSGPMSMNIYFSTLMSE